MRRGRRLKNGFEKSPYPYETPEIVRLLRTGFGVEDIAAMGVCSEKKCRDVIEWLRDEGRLARIFSAMKAQHGQG